MVAGAAPWAAGRGRTNLPRAGHRPTRPPSSESVGFPGGTHIFGRRPDTGNGGNGGNGGNPFPRPGRGAHAMGMQEFNADELVRAVAAAGGRDVVVTRLAELFSTSRDTARKQLDRALGAAAVPRGRRRGVGADIAGRLLAVLGVPKDRRPNLFKTAPPERTADPGWLRLGAEPEPPETVFEDLPDHGRVAVGCWQGLVSLANLSSRPATVTALRVELATETGPWRRLPSIAGTPSYDEPPRLSLYLSPDGYSGRWTFSYRDPSGHTRGFAPNAANLLAGPEGGRMLIHIPPGDLDWMDVEIAPEGVVGSGVAGGTVFTVVLAAEAADAFGSRACGRSAPLRVY